MHACVQEAGYNKWVCLAISVEIISQQEIK